MIWDIFLLQVDKVAFEVAHDVDGIDPAGSQWSSSRHCHRLLLGS